MSALDEFAALNLDCSSGLDVGNIDSPVASKGFLREEVFTLPRLAGEFLKNLMKDDFVLAQWSIARLSTFKFLNQLIDPW